MSKTAPLTYGRRYMNYVAQRGGHKLTVRQERQLQRMEDRLRAPWSLDALRRELAERGLLGVSLTMTKCTARCEAHGGECLRVGHTGPHYCGACPWPASKLMVRHATA